MPLYLGQGGLHPLHVAGIIGAMSLALIVTEVLALGVTWRVGRRAAVVLGLMGSAVMFAWCPLAVSLAGLYVTRLALGAVPGMLWPVTLAEVAGGGPRSRRAGVLSICWWYCAVGQRRCPRVGGCLGEQF